jgi:hypothetical protein
MSGVDQWVLVDEWCGSTSSVWVNGYRWMSGVDQWVPMGEWFGSMSTGG